MRSLYAPLACLLFASALRAEDDWTRFRGPTGTGSSKATGLPAVWSEEKNIAWKASVHDKGWSSPVILGKQVWVTTARDGGKAQCALCFDLGSGKVAHDGKVFDTPR